MPDQTIKIFLASSVELQADRDEFRLYISSENSRLNPSGVFLEVVCREDFSNEVAQEGKQSQYNEALRQCDVAVFLVFSKVGQFTDEEFEVAFKALEATNKPAIFTYFKNTPLFPESIKQDDINSLFSFKEKLKKRNHYRTVYREIPDMMFGFRNEFEKIINKPAPAPENLSVKGNENDAVINIVHDLPSAYIYNEILTNRLFEAILDKSEKTKNLLEGAKENGVVWQNDPDCQDMAKDIIAGAYIGIVGIQVRKLMAIGKEEMPDTKAERYVKNCQLTAFRVLQFLCFTLICKLWDERDNNLVYTAAQVKVFNNFFTNTLELNMFAFRTLFTVLFSVFVEKGLDFPIPELKTLENSLNDDSDFLLAFKKLHEITNNTETMPLAEPDCYNAEILLTAILEKLSFLVNYNMESIKNIEYYGLRKIKELYLHNFTELSIEESAGISRDEVKESSYPSNTYAVMLYNNKIEYQPRLNLFPFVIDVNALTADKGAKIYFFASCGAKNGLNFSFWENKENKLPIPDTGKIDGVADGSVKGVDGAKFNPRRLSDILTLFQDAKQVLTRTA